MKCEANLENILKIYCSRKMYIELNIVIIKEKCMSIISITLPHKLGLRTENIQT